MILYKGILVIKCQTLQNLYILHGSIALLYVHPYRGMLLLVKPCFDICLLKWIIILYVFEDYVDDLLYPELIFFVLGEDGFHYITDLYRHSLRILRL